MPFLQELPFIEPLQMYMQQKTAGFHCHFCFKDIHIYIYIYIVLRVPNTGNKATDKNTDIDFRKNKFQVHHWSLVHAELCVQFTRNLDWVF